MTAPEVIEVQQSALRRREISGVSRRGGKRVERGGQRPAGEWYLAALTQT